MVFSLCWVEDFWKMLNLQTQADFFFFCLGKGHTVTRCILLYPTRGPMSRAESITPSFGRDTTRLLPGTERWTFCCLAYFFLFLVLFRFWFFGFVGGVLFPEVTNTLELLSLYYPFTYVFSTGPGNLSEACCFNSLIWTSDPAWKIFIPITRSYS